MQRDTLAAVGLGLDVDVVEAVVATVEGRGRGSPGGLPDGEVLVETLAALRERNPQRVVLGPVPARRGQHDEPALAEQVERGERLGQRQRVAQRRDHRGGKQPQPARQRRHRGEQHLRVGPGHRRILVAGHRVLARVGHQTVGVGAGAEHDVLAEHDRVEARVLGLGGHPGEARGGRAARSSSSTR